MTAGFAEQLAMRVPDVIATAEFGDPVATVPAEWWTEAVRTCRDELGLTYLDVLTGVDDGDTLGVVLYLWSRAAAAGLLLRTSVPAGQPELASITPLLPGADWHERETAEMFGIVFSGHPNPVPLLLPDPPPVPTPLRKRVGLERRTGWPGEAEPA